MLPNILRLKFSERRRSASAYEGVHNIPGLVPGQKEEKKMRLVNLTPHVLNVRKADGTFLELPPSGTVARRSVERVVVGDVDGITVYATKFGQLEGLPEPSEDTVFIVSALAAQACGDRDDVLVPGEAIRDEAGRVVGCDGLVRAEA